jgi:hypothetical protein
MTFRLIQKTMLLVALGTLASAGVAQTPWTDLGGSSDFVSVGDNTGSPGLTTGQWCPDRYSPNGWTPGDLDPLGNPALHIHIDNSDRGDLRNSSYSDAFYNTQGRTRPAVQSWEVGGQLFIPASASLTNKLFRSDIWTRDNSTNENYANYPIVGFVNNDPADPFNANSANFVPRFRVWNSYVGWVDLTGTDLGIGDLTGPNVPIIYGAYNTFRIVDTGSSYDFYINGAMVYTLTAADGFYADVNDPANDPAPAGLTNVNGFKQVFIETYNFGEASNETTALGGDNSLPDSGYDVYWQDVYATNTPAGVTSVTSDRGNSNPGIAGGVGKSLNVTVNFANPAPFGGTVVTLGSSDPNDTISGGGSYSANPGETSHTFSVTPTVDQATNESVTLTAGITSSPPMTFPITVVPFLQSIVFGGGSVNSGGHISGTLHAYEAPATDQTANINCVSPDVSGPSSITIPAGQGFSGPITYQVIGVDSNASVSVTATLVGGASSATGGFTVNAPVFHSISFSPSTVIATQSSTVTVNLTGPVNTATSVTLTSANTGLASSVVVPIAANASSGSTTVTTSNYVGAATTSVAFNETFRGTTAFAGRLYITPDVLRNIVFTSSPVNAGTNATATVTVTAALPTEQDFNLTLNTTPATTVPVAIPAYASSVLVQVPTPYAFGTRAAVYTLSGTYNGASAHASINVTPNSLTGLQVSNSSISEIGGSTSVTANLAFATPSTGGATAIALTSSNTAVISSGASISIPAGSSSASVTVTPNMTNLAAAKAVTLSATYGVKHTTSAITVNPEIVSLSFSPGSVPGGSSVTGTITLFAPYSGTGTVTATINSSSCTLQAGTNPIAINTGATTYTFKVNAKNRASTYVSPLAITVSIAGLGYTRTAKLNVLDGP